jgi:hypothetical protein
MGLALVVWFDRGFQEARAAIFLEPTATDYINLIFPPVFVLYTTCVGWLYRKSIMPMFCCFILQAAATAAPITKRLRRSYKPEDTGPITRQMDPPACGKHCDPFHPVAVSVHAALAVMPELAHSALAGLEAVTSGRGSVREDTGRG